MQDDLRYAMKKLSEPLDVNLGYEEVRVFHVVRIILANGDIGCVTRASIMYMRLPGPLQVSQRYVRCLIILLCIMYLCFRRHNTGARLWSDTSTADNDISTTDVNKLLQW
jgi:hypothetical protein